MKKKIIYTVILTAKKKTVTDKQVDKFDYTDNILLWLTSSSVKVIVHKALSELILYTGTTITFDTIKEFENKACNMEMKACSRHSVESSENNATKITQHIFFQSTDIQHTAYKYV